MKFQQVVDEILNGAEEPVSKEQAKRNLIACGILDENGEVKDVYKKLFVMEEIHNEDKEQRADPCAS